MRLFQAQSRWSGIVATLLLAGQAAQAIQLDVTNADSLKAAAKTSCDNMMSYYHGSDPGQIPGKLPGTWWEGGALFMTTIWYWHFTGDLTYNNVTTQGMLWQAGSGYDYMPANWSNYLGNDDQVFWAFAAMTAAELKYPEPEGNDPPSWLGLAQGVFNDQAARWDTSSCGGGLRWQLYPYQAGYTIKNAISNGGFFQLAARLAYYTSNHTYADWAIKMWDWCETSPLLNTTDWTIADTATTESNCTSYDVLRWTYNYGTFLMGAAYMYNFTNGSDLWSGRVDNLLKAIDGLFFPTQYGGNIMSEVACETNQLCNRNQVCFKAFLSAWMAFTTTLVPWTTDQIMPKLQASAVGAAAQCSGGDDHTSCGRRWWQKTWDGFTGMEEEMSATGVFSSNLIAFVQSRPLTAHTGGNSTSDPGAGTSGDSNPVPNILSKKITTGDKVGAGIVSILTIGSWLALLGWIIKED